MNKRFSTLMTAGLLMMGTLLGGANAQTTAVEVDLTKADALKPYYFIGTDANGYLKAVEKTITNDDNAKRTTLEGVSTVSSLSDAQKNDCLFKLEVVSDGSAANNKYLQLRSKSGKVIEFSTGQTAAANLVAASGDLITGSEAKNTLYTSLFVMPASSKIQTSGAEFKLFHGGATASTQCLTITSGTLTCGSTMNLKVYSVDEDTKDASKLNALNADRGSISFAAKDIESSIFGKNIKAFEVTEFTSGSATVASGTYFATSYPEEWASNKNTITTLDEFQACTLIAVDPSTSLGTAAERKEGKYFTFKEVAGADFNFAGNSQDAEIAVQNAAFTVSTNLNQEDGKGNYNYTILVNFRYRPEAAADKKDHAASGSCAIASGKINNVQSLTVSKGNAKSYIFTLAAGPIAKPINLLSKTGASIYNILFTSGEATAEKGKYLGVGSENNSSWDFLAQGTAVANLNTPQYQFIISKVDTKENKVTFKNRETSQTFECILDTTTTANVYTIVSTTGSVTLKAATLSSGTYSYANVGNLAGKTIQLIPATVDKFAGFSVRGMDADQTFITFAKDANNTEKKFMVISYDGRSSCTQEVATDKEGEASLFELVRSSEKPKYIRHDYAYDQNGVAVTKTGGDSIAYYTYYIKYVSTATTAAPYYLKNTDLTLNTTPVTTNEFVVKENNDGSVSIIAAPTAPAFLAANAKAIKFDATSTKKAVIAAGNNPYINAAAADLKLFLVKEQLGASLEAKIQHAALEAETGGFISMDSKNGAIVAIKTTADEDLTFWLDTADSKATLPSFYISKGMKATKAASADRLFMYYAKDSADYVTAEPNPYKWSNGKEKVIFKAATLVNSDTLTTVAKGKTVNVAMKADVNGTQAGLANFRYQIFKADDAEDAYVVRCANGNYLTSLNNQLVLDTDKDKALRIYVETQEAPTANDPISASTIQVIAGDGAVQVIGAQGKKVVVSNILGQAVANTVATSDDATIAAPAGIVVVAIEGEAAVKAIVK